MVAKPRMDYYKLELPSTGIQESKNDSINAKHTYMFIWIRIYIHNEIQINVCV